MDNLDFKFRFVKGGRATGFLAKKGNVSTSGLMLDEDRVPWEAIADTDSRDNRIIIAFDPAWRTPPRLSQQLLQGAAVALEVTSGSGAEGVERAIDRHASRHEVAAHKAELEARGEGDKFRSVVCPSCQAQVDLSGLHEGRYVYCRFCTSLFDARSRKAADGEGYRLCGECEMFDRVQGYTEFYFYFLLVVYGFRYQRRHLCDACAGKLFWKVFALNAIFVLGVPSALWLKAKSMRGKPEAFKSLARANTLARKGRHKEADAAFAEISRTFPDHPGVLYNQALGHLLGNDARGGARLIEKCLESCPNYGPALSLVAKLTSPSSPALPPG
jgi:hypothetical protein